MATNEQAWASGRVLSSAQRARKRAVDRERSSRRRQQTTSRINSLEARLTALEGGSRVETNSPKDISGVAECTAGSALNEDAWHNVRSTDPNGDTSAVEYDQSSECQSLFNEALLLARNLSRNAVSIDAPRNEDALVRGILYGWDEVFAETDFCCPLWTIIRFLDSRLFRLSGTITRFCTLTMIHNMLLYLVNANELSSLPAWYRPRPSQKFIAHPLAVDVLPWPGLRERAVLDPALTLSNRFWSDAIYCFRFIWPHEEIDAIKVDPQSKLLSFTGRFHNSMRDIQKWTMDEAFFEAFPETFDDIVPAPRLEWPLVGGCYWPNSALNDFHLLPLPASEDEVCLERVRESAVLAEVLPVVSLDGFSVGGLVPEFGL